MGRRSVALTNRGLLVVVVLSMAELLLIGPAAAANGPRPPEGQFNAFLDHAFDYLGTRDGGGWIEWPKAGGAIAHFGIVNPTPEDLQWLRQRAPRHTTIKVKAVQFSNDQIHRWASRIDRRFDPQAKIIWEISLPKANRIFIGMKRWDGELVRDLRTSFPRKALRIRKVAPSEYALGGLFEPRPLPLNPWARFLSGWEVPSIG